MRSLAFARRNLGFVRLTVALCCLLSAAVWLYTSTRTLPSVAPSDEAFLYPGTWQIYDVRQPSEGTLQFRVRFLDKQDDLNSPQATLLARLEKDADPLFQYKLKPDENWFEISRPNGLKSSFVAQYAPSQRYAENSSTEKPKGLVSIGTFGTLLASGKSSQVSDWIHDFSSVTLPRALEPEEHEAGEPGLSSSQLRFAKWLEGKQGWPSDRIIRSDVGTAFQLVDSGKEKIWCGNITNLFMAYSSHVDLQTRPVMLTNIKGEVSVSGHVTAETYRPSLARWQLVDPTLGFYEVEDQQGLPLNALEFHQLLAVKNPVVGDLTFKVFDATSGILRSRKWSELPSDSRLMIQRFYGMGAQLVYRMHPQVGSEDRSFSYRAANRLFDFEQMHVYAPLASQMAFLTPFHLHVYSRAGTIALLTLLLLSFCIPPAKKSKLEWQSAARIRIPLSPRPRVVVDEERPVFETAD